MKSNSFLQYLLGFFFALLALASSSEAKKIPYGADSLTLPQNKTEKHFDRNRDGYLNPYERLLILTQAKFGYPLAKQKKQAPYDTNDNGMLEPPELRLYQLDVDSGKIKAVWRENKTKVRLKEKARRTLSKTRIIQPY